MRVTRNPGAPSRDSAVHPEGLRGGHRQRFCGQEKGWRLEEGGGWGSKVPVLGPRPENQVV